MKRCPKCERTYRDETLRFCRDDGTQLITDFSDESPTRTIGSNSFASAPGQTQGLGFARQVGTAETVPETRYARSGEMSIAYQVVGDGPIDLIYVPGWVSHVEYGWEQPLVARFFRRLASFSRLILFDKRGTGLSDQTSDLPTLEQRMDDVRAVMEAVGSERAAVFGMSEGGNMAMLFAATYPERTLGLITFGVFAKRVWEPDYPWAPTQKERQKVYDLIEKEWGGPLGIEDLAPSLAKDPAFREWWASYQRRSASPRAAQALMRMNTLIDVRNVLPAIRVPTLIMHRTGDRDSNVEEGRYIAAHISGAKFVELPGEDHLLYAGDQDSVLDLIEEFLKDLNGTPDSDMVLATVLSIEDATGAGDLHSDSSERLQAMARREAEWFKGRVSDNQVESFVAIFDGPARAIRCACAISNAARNAVIATRIGLHTGLCEVSGNKIAGVAVDVARELARRASIGEIIVSRSILDLVPGSRIEFHEKGEAALDAVSGALSLYSVDPESCVS